jgi:hypothetical protein
VLTVIRPSSGSVRAVIEFANRQVSAQLEHGFKPDAKYPTDVISLQQLQAVVEGRAIRVLDGEFSLVPNNSEDRVLDYRIWLYELISHNLGLLSGDIEKLQKATQSALRTTFMLGVAQGVITDKSSIDTVKRDIFRPAGLTKALTPRVLDLLVQELNESGLAYVQGAVFSMSTNYVNEQFKKMLEARMPEEPEYIVEWENFNTLGCGFARKA